MTDYSYDDTGVYFAYFVVSVLSIILIPLSYFWLSDSAKPFINESACLCSLCESKFTKIRIQDRNSRRVSQLVKLSLLCAGWILIAYLGSVIYTTEIVLPAQWDPWIILGVSKTAVRSDVKRAYHKLAITQHPDKISDAILKIKANAIFSDISKAYKVLTDKEAFKKFEEWGDPDGKQSFSMGIALPTSLVAVKNSSLVLLVYGLIFGGLLPWRIGKWWYKTRKYTKDQVLSLTMGTLFKQMHETTTFRALMVILAHASEFGDPDDIPYKGEEDEKLCTQLELFLKQAQYENGDIAWDWQSDLAKITKPSARKAYLQLSAHLLSPDGYIPNDHAERTVTKMAHIVQRGLLPITLARGWLVPSLFCMDLTQLIAQGLWKSRSSIWQVPHITQDHIRIMKARDPVVETIQDFAELSDSARHNIFANSITNSQYQDIQAFLAAYPRIVLEKLNFKVIGEPTITPDALVTCTIQIRLVPISISREQLQNEYEAKNSERRAVFQEKGDTPTVLKATTLDSENDEVDEDNDEESDSDLDAFDLEGEGDGGRGGKAASKLVANIKPSHAPKFPKNKRPGWWVFIGNLGGNRVINAQRVSDLQERRTIKIQFQAPSNAGVYPFSVFIKSDHWLGSDMRLDVQMKVDPVTMDRQAALMQQQQEDDDEISDPDEDTLAGQMAVLRGHKTKQSYANGEGGGANHGGQSSSDSSDDDE